MYNLSSNDETGVSLPPASTEGKIRVGLTTSVMQRGQSGIARYICSLLDEFQQVDAGFEFVIFVLRDDLPLFEFLDASVQIVAVSERFRAPVSDILWHQWILPRRVKQYRLDVIHVPSYRRMMANAPCKKLATIHDLAPFRLSGKYDRARMFYGRIIARFLARRQDGILVVSQATADDVQRYYGTKTDQVQVIQNGIDHRKFYPGDAVGARRRVKELHAVDGPFFLYVARFEHPGKNHCRLIDAFDRFKERTGSHWQLVLGGGDWHGAETIHEKIGDSPYRKDIQTMGFIPEEELPAWYRAADVFVFPSLFEGFGLPPLEAMACGCPVICSTRGSLKEIVGDAAALIDAEDTDDLAEKMTELATGESLCSALRAKGLEWVQSFTWKRCAAETMGAYRRIHEGALESEG